MLFSPCLWEPREGISQVLFAGAHADVGGGYPKKEAGLSNAPLAWMMQSLQEAVSVRFCEPPPASDHTAIMHDESQKALFSAGAEWRAFKAESQLQIHQSLVDRAKASPTYAPRHLSPHYLKDDKIGFSPVCRTPGTAS